MPFLFFQRESTMPRYILEVEAFQFNGKNEADYPGWFVEALNSGMVQPCGADYHVYAINANEEAYDVHICPGDYVIKESDYLAVIPAEEFEVAFKEVTLQS